MPVYSSQRWLRKSREPSGEALQTSAGIVSITSRSWSSLRRRASSARWRSSISLGFGIWSMHFTGMLAFRLPVLVSYSWPTVLLSLLVAISASAFALYVVSRHELGMPEYRSQTHGRHADVMHGCNTAAHNHAAG